MQIEFLIFTLNNNKYAVLTSDIVKIIQMVKITELPNAPAIIEGVINFHGEVVPIVNLKKRLSLPQNSADMYIIIAKTKKRTLGLLTDSVLDIASGLESELIPKEKFNLPAPYLKGICKLKDDIIMINDIEEFLSLEEEELLAKALAYE